MPSQIVQFDDFELDFGRYQLRRGDRVVKLEKNPMELLILLVEKEGRLVTREEIIQRLWGDDVFVDTRHGINTAVHKLRTALRDDAGRPRVLGTVVGKGYRLVADVAKTPASGVADDHDSSRDRSLRPQVAAQMGTELQRSRFDSESQPAPERVTNGDSKLRYSAVPNRIWISAGTMLLALLLCVGIWWISRISAEAKPPTIQMVSLAGVPSGQQYTAAFSPDGNQLAFGLAGAQNPGIYTTLTDGDKALRLTSNPGDCCPVWSPDGQQIAFSRRNSGEGLAIYVVSALGGTEHRLYREPANFPWNHPGYLDWSPDAKFIAFSEREEDDAHASIALLSLADSTTRRLTTPPDQAYDYAPSFSPDGSTVTFIRRNGAGVASDVFVVSAAGGEPRRLTFDNAAIDGMPVWTADGRDIVFSSIRGGLPTLWRISATVGGLRSIAGVGATACCPSISRKGNQLVYQNSVSNYGIWRVDLKDQTRVQNPPNLLISSNGRNWRPDFSPDGRRIVFESDRSGYIEIWTCDANGSNCGQLTSLHGVAGTARWSPDGSRIAFEFTPGEHSEIYVVDVAGGRPRLVPTLPGADNLAPNWSRDGQWIYFASDYESGRFDLWKVPLHGGSPVRVTKNGGDYGVESADRRFLYYSKLDAPGIWKRPLNGGEETRILDQSGLDQWYNWALAPNGIYFLNRAAKPRETIEFLNFESGKIVPILSPDKWVNWGVTVSPDGSSLMYVQNDFFQSNLVLVKNYR